MEPEPFLRFGDLILLWCEDVVAPNDTCGFLGRHGSLETSVVISKAGYSDPPPRGVRECIFRVCRPYAYSAQQEYDDYLLRLESVDSTTFTPDEQQKFLDKRENLRRKMLQERGRNAIEVVNHFGDRVVFGDTIQLQHWRSGDFLDVSPGTIAEMEPSAMKLTLSDCGSPRSHMTVTPLHKIRRVGHPVSVDDDVLLKIHGTGHEHYVHATFGGQNGQALSSGSNLRDHEPITAEGNCFFEGTAFRIRRFDSAWGRSETMLNIGTMVQIFHPDSDQFVRSFEKVDPVSEASNRASASEGKQSSIRHVPSPSPGKTKGTLTRNRAKLPPVSSSLSPKVGGSSSAPKASADGKFTVQCGSIATSAVPPVGALWMVEGANAVAGGLADFNSRFRLKNFETKEYLAYRTKATTVDFERKQVSVEVLTTVKQPGPGTLFGFRPATPLGGDDLSIVNVTKAVHLVPVDFVGDKENTSKSERTKMLSNLCVCVVNVSSTHFPRVTSGTVQPLQRPSLSGAARSFQLHLTTQPHLRDAFVVQPLSLEQLRPYDMCLELLSRFQKLSLGALKLTSSTAETGKRIVQDLGQCLIQLHVFQYSDGGASLAENDINVQDTTGVLTMVDDARFTWPTKALSSRRQLILCEMGHNAIMKRQELLMNSLHVLKKTARHTTDEVEKQRAGEAAEQLRRLCNMVYSLTTLMCMGGNTHCRSIMQRHVSTMLVHVLDEVGAYDAMKEIVRDNASMLMNNPALTQQVEDLARNLRHYGFVPDLLEFLEVLCLCNGVAVMQNQAAIVETIVKRNHSCLVHFCLREDVDDDLAPKLEPSDEYPCFDGQSLGPSLLQRKHPILIGWVSNDHVRRRNEEGAVPLSELFPEDQIISRQPRGLTKGHSQVNFTKRSDDPKLELPTEWVSLTYFVDEVMKAAFEVAEEAEFNAWSDYSTVNSSSKQNSSRDKLLTMYEFAVTQLRLLAKCCVERNYLGIQLLRGEFTVELLLTGLHDPRVSCELRECFASLLSALHIDVAPHRSVNVPSRTYVVYDAGSNDNLLEDTKGWNETEDADMSAGHSNRDALGVPEPFKFSVVQQILLSIFQDLDESDNAALFKFIPSGFGSTKEQQSNSLNDFVASIMKLVKQLILFGFFSTEQLPGLLDHVLDQIQKFIPEDALPKSPGKLGAMRSNSFNTMILALPSKDAKVHPASTVGDSDNVETSAEDASTKPSLKAFKVPALAFAFTCAGLVSSVILLIYGLFFNGMLPQTDQHVAQTETFYNAQMIFLMILIIDYCRVLLFRRKADTFFGFRDIFKICLLLFVILDVLHYLFFSLNFVGVIFYRCLRVVVYGCLLAFYLLTACKNQADYDDDSLTFIAEENSDYAVGGLEDDGKRAEKLHLLDVLASIQRLKQQEAVADLMDAICNGSTHENGGPLIQNNQLVHFDSRGRRLVQKRLSKLCRDPGNRRVIELCSAFMQWDDPAVVAGAIKNTDTVLTSGDAVLRCVQSSTVLTDPDAILVFKILRDEFWSLCDLVEQFELYVGATSTDRSRLFFEKANSRLDGVVYSKSLVGVEDLDAKYLFDETNKIQADADSEKSVRHLVARIYQLLVCFVDSSPIVASQFFSMICEEEFVRRIGFAPGAVSLVQKVVECNPSLREFLPSRVVKACVACLDVVASSSTKKNATQLQPFENWTQLELSRAQLAALHLLMELQISDDVTGARQLATLRIVTHTRSAERRRITNRLYAPVSVPDATFDEDYQTHIDKLAELGRSKTPLRSAPRGQRLWPAHVQCARQSRLLYMLAFSCSGDSTLIQSKVESILHFSRVVEWVVSPKTYWNLKAAGFVFLRFTSVEGLLGVDYADITKKLFALASTVLKYTNDACQISHTYDILRRSSQQVAKVLRDDFMEFEPAISHHAIFVGSDYENLLLFQICGLHILPLLTLIATQLSSQQKNTFREIMRDVQGKVARLLKWTERNGYNYAKQIPTLGTAGASIIGCTCFQVFAFRIRELHDILATRFGSITESVTSTPVKSPPRSLLAESKTPSRQTPVRRMSRRSSLTPSRHRTDQSVAKHEITMQAIQDLKDQQADQLLVSTRKYGLQMFDRIHSLAKSQPSKFGIALRNLMGVLTHCLQHDESQSLEQRKNDIKRWSAEHHESLRAGGYSTARQIVVKLLRGVLIPKTERSLTIPESYAELVVARRDLDSHDAHAEQMRLQLLYVGALETACLLYGQFQDDPLGTASLKLAVALMSRTPSQESKHQDIMHDFLRSDESATFFRRCVKCIEEYTQRVRNEWLLPNFAGVVTTKNTEEIKFLLQLLRLCCLSKHSGNQNILRERVAVDGSSFSIITALCNLFAALAQTCDQTVPEPAKCEKYLSLAMVVSQSLEDMVVGPCMPNQHFMAFQTSILHVINQVFRNRVYFDDYGDVIDKFPERTLVNKADNDHMISLVQNLQTAALNLMKAMLEGRPDSAVHQKLCETIELPVLIKPMARAHESILKESEHHKGPQSNFYQRSHSDQLTFGCSMMDLFLQLQRAQPLWWNKHFDDVALDRMFKAGVYTKEEVDAIKYFQGKLLHIDVLWKIFDVGGGAGETVSMPVLGFNPTAAQEADYVRKMDLYLESQTPRFLRQRFYFKQPTITYFTSTAQCEQYLEEHLDRESRESKLRSLLRHSAFLFAQMKIQRSIFEATNGSRMFSSRMMSIVEGMAFWTGVIINFLLIVSLQHNSGFGHDKLIAADVFQVFSLKLSPYFAESAVSQTENIITTMLSVLVIASILLYLCSVILRIINVNLAYGIRVSHARQAADEGPGDDRGDSQNNGGDSSSDDSAVDDMEPMSEGAKKAYFFWKVARNSFAQTPSKANASLLLYVALMCCGIAYIINRGSGSTSPVLMSLTLLQFFLRNSYIGLVLEAVTSTLQQLAYTLVGMVIVMYIFAVVAFNHFATDFDDGQCVEMWYVELRSALNVVKGVCNV